MVIEECIFEQMISGADVLGDIDFEEINLE